MKAAAVKVGRFCLLTAIFAALAAGLALYLAAEGAVLVVNRITNKKRNN